jgi:hypothetical protein
MPRCRRMCKFSGISRPTWEGRNLRIPAALTEYRIPDSRRDKEVSLVIVNLGWWRDQTGKSSDNVANKRVSKRGSELTITCLRQSFA